MNDDSLSGIIGSGWSLPGGVNGRGSVALSKGDVDIEESIRIILATAKGERRMRPDFGCAIHDLLFSPNDDTTWGLARYAVEEALGWWEPRISVEEVEVGPNQEQPNRMDIVISYRVRATKDARTLVYPFYLITPEE